MIGVTIVDFAYRLQAGDIAPASLSREAALREALVCLLAEASWLQGQLNGYGQTTMKKTKAIFDQAESAAQTPAA